MIKRFLIVCGIAFAALAAKATPDDSIKHATTTKDGSFAIKGAENDVHLYIYYPGKNVPFCRRPYNTDYYFTIEALNENGRSPLCKALKY